MQLILSRFCRRIPPDSQVQPVGIRYNMLVEVARIPCGVAALQHERYQDTVSEQKRKRNVCSLQGRFSSMDAFCFVTQRSHGHASYR